MTVATSTIQSNILRELGRNPSDTYMLARSLRWINKTLDKMQQFFPDVDFLQSSEMNITTVASQATYAMPSDFLSINQIRIDTENQIIDFLTREDFDRRHPYPSDEDEDVPSDATLEYDRDNNRFFLRLAPIPDDAYDIHGIMRRWHPELSGTQKVQYDKLETAIEEGGIYHGSLSVYSDKEYIQYRAELKQNWLETVRGLQQILNQVKVKPRQIPTILRKGDY